MNRDDIIRWAREARLAEPSHPMNPWGASDEGLERFANLVYEQVFRDANYAATRTVTDAAIALEREACAKVCDERAEAAQKEYAQTTGMCRERIYEAEDCAAAIRARSVNNGTR